MRLKIHGHQKCRKFKVGDISCKSSDAWFWVNCWRCRWFGFFGLPSPEEL